MDRFMSKQPTKIQKPDLWLRKARYNKKRNLTHAARYYIIDGDDRHSTGCGADEVEKALVKLHEYNVAKHAALSIKPPSEKARDRVLVADVLDFYIETNKLKIARKAPEEKRNFGRMMENLLYFWSGKTVDDITSE